MARCAGQDIRNCLKTHNPTFNHSISGKRSNMALDERFERLQCAAALVSRMEHTDVFEARPRSLGPVCVAR